MFILSILQNLGVDRISLDDRKSKSFEERTEEYLEARSRIFKEVNDHLGLIIIIIIIILGLKHRRCLMHTSSLLGTQTLFPRPPSKLVSSILIVIYVRFLLSFFLMNGLSAPISSTLILRFLNLGLWGQVASPLPQSSPSPPHFLTDSVRSVYSS